ncbi:four helix bundle protein [Acetobacteraceae bacterium]|nr:four helix bundle protein [Candidatus Parcubacteria bacterium]
MSEARSFRDLIVWQKSMDLTKQIYLVTRSLPSEERFGIISQMRRCAVSIPSNIAEGNKRSTAKDYAQFLKVASGSAAELETQLLLVRDIYQMPAENLLILLDEIQRMLQVLTKRLLQPKT